MSEKIDPLLLINEQMSSNKSELPQQLFSENPEIDEIALKTDLIHKEHVFVSVLMTENKLISNLFGDDFNLYGDFLNQFRRHKVSLDRKSRLEFVDVLRGGVSEKDLNTMSNLKNITDTRT